MQVVGLNVHFCIIDTLKVGLGEFWNKEWKSSALFENPLMPRIVYLYYHFHPGTHNQSI